MRILLVEDNPADARLVQEAFRDSAGERIELHHAGRLADAIERARALHPDVVLLDLSLPDSFGLDTVRRLQAAVAEAPIVVLTGLNDETLAMEALRNGAQDYLVKDELDRPLVLRALRYAGERHRHEQALRRQNRLLDEAARSERAAHEALKQAQSRLVAAEKLAGLGQMVAGVAHEINNPLSFVGNNLAVLQREVGALVGLLAIYREADAAIAAARPDVAERTREARTRGDLDTALAMLPRLIDRSLDGVKRIRQIVRDLRDFARLDAAGAVEADLAACIESTLHIIAGRARAAQVELSLDLAPLPPVTCNPAKLNQVVLNLLANAVDACIAGGRVTVRTRRDGGGVAIEVEDTGCGIPAEVRERIFDPFFTTKPPGQGTGLGLSISYGIVRDHGGTIEVESEPGRGSRFTVRLPGPEP